MTDYGVLEPGVAFDNFVIDVQYSSVTTGEIILTTNSDITTGFAVTTGQNTEPEVSSIPDNSNNKTAIIAGAAGGAGGLLLVAVIVALIGNV